MDGLLIVDKPSGPTSHDVVARVRRILGERRVGHTGTLDPLASGVLPLVIGRATRLARFLEGDKKYDAVIRLGVKTDTYDLLGEPVGEQSSGPWPDRAHVEAALAPFIGTFLQRPPAFSAKKIAGERSYDIARRMRHQPEAERTVAPAPVAVTTHGIEVLDAAGPEVRLRVHCSAGFYVRSLAHDLGEALGLGAHLTALRRIEAAGASVERAIPLAELEAGPSATASRALMPMDQMLAALPSVVLTRMGVTNASRGRDLGASDTLEGFSGALQAALEAPARHVRVMGPDGHLVAMAEAARVPGLLHPVVVLV